MSELLGNYAIITGASRGLGAGMAVRLAKMGYNIVINYQSDSSKEKAAGVLKEAAKQAQPLKMFGQVEDIADLMEYLVNAKYVTGQTISPNGGCIMPA